MSLKRLLELQSKKKQENAAGVPGPSTAASSESETTANSPGDESPAPASKPNPKRLPFGNKPKSGAAAGTLSTGKADTNKTPAPKKELDFDNLGSFDLSEIGEVESQPEQIEGSGFFDEIEATAPDRELPEDLSQQGREFVELLDSTYTIINDADMFAQQIRTIMMELQENPEYEKLISDMDVHVMIRAMRNTMGLARIRKQAKKRTGSGSSRSTKTSRKKALMDKALSLSIGMEID